MGYIVATMFYDLFLHRFDGQGIPIVYYASVISIASIFGIVSLCIKNNIIEVSTSLIGSHFTIKMIGFMIGNFPDEKDIAQRIYAGEYKKMPSVVYIYTAFTLVLATIGLLLQLYLKKVCPSKKIKNARKAKEYFESFI